MKSFEVDVGCLLVKNFEYVLKVAKLNNRLEDYISTPYLLGKRFYLYKADDVLVNYLKKHYDLII